MKKNVIILFLMISCNSNKEIINGCNENKEFKKVFFSHFDYIKNNIYIRQDIKFRESLIFISNYTHVSLDRIVNYSGTYPYGVFIKDSVIWRNWYEENKCNNIQLKKELIIPEILK
ncbi:hypothetical protein SAMN05444377_10371 [Flavobacterium fontis]|uniref:Uncharacterized protein n=1 Tax=Flavobacterium fontis TaxID=1124188 RepID=A0A1M4YEB3_9FLAO|nr:hypothetical protein [Flavobacterium fontis]SHF04117.1 hypothetical protein SAMN05444377_10371 [Flavobacterium fontis]